MTLKIAGAGETGADTREDLLTLRVPEDAERRERLAVLLYDLRAVSQGNAARIAGLTRADFLDALGRYGVTPFQYDGPEELAADVAAAMR